MSWPGWASPPLLTTGVSSTVPAPILANVGMAMSGLRNWAHALHTELRPEGVYAGTVTIASGIVPGDGETDPDAIGARLRTPSALPAVLCLISANGCGQAHRDGAEANVDGSVCLLDVVDVIDGEPGERCGPLGVEEQRQAAGGLRT